MYEQLMITALSNALLYLPRNLQIQGGKMHTMLVHYIPLGKYRKGYDK